MFKHALAGATALALVALPAHAAVVNDYSSTDDVWNAPIAPGHSLVDLRSALGFQQGFSVQPAGSYVFGVAPRMEAGIWSSLGGGGLGGLLSSFNPYLKYELPLKLGGVGFGLVAGGQVPTGPGSDPNLGLEGVVLLPLGLNSADLGLGVGRSFGAGATLAHANLAMYVGLPGSQTLVAEVYTNVSSLTAPVFGQHLGWQLPLGSGWSGDLGAVVTETPAGFAGFAPQLGVTLAL